MTLNTEHKKSKALVSPRNAAFSGLAALFFAASSACDQSNTNQTSPEKSPNENRFLAQIDRAELPKLDGLDISDIRKENPSAVAGAKVINKYFGIPAVATPEGGLKITVMRAGQFGNLTLNSESVSEWNGRLDRTARFLIVNGKDSESLTATCATAYIDLRDMIIGKEPLALDEGFKVGTNLPTRLTADYEKCRELVAAFTDKKLLEELPNEVGSFRVPLDIERRVGSEPHLVFVFDDTKCAIFRSITVIDAERGRLGEIIPLPVSQVAQSLAGVAIAVTAASEQLEETPEVGVDPRASSLALEIGLIKDAFNR